jgi:DNA replication protein DnaC
MAFLSPPGAGKTMLAWLWLSLAARAGFSIYFTTLDDMVRQLRDTKATGRFAKKLQTYLKPSVLVLDEVGHPPPARPEANVVFQLISRRYEREQRDRYVQQGPRGVGLHLRRRRVGCRHPDRLLHHCEVVSINGPSYRLKNHLAITKGGGS